MRTKKWNGRTLRRKLTRAIVQSIEFILPHTSKICNNDAAASTGASASHRYGHTVNICRRYITQKVTRKRQQEIQNPKRKHTYRKYIDVYMDGMMRRIALHIKNPYLNGVCDDRRWL